MVVQDFLLGISDSCISNPRQGKLEGRHAGLCYTQECRKKGNGRWEVRVGKMQDEVKVSVLQGLDPTE